MTRFALRTPEPSSVEWYTPPAIFAALGLKFDLDPCSPPGGLPWIPARQFYSLPDDGLTLPWEGRVWLNPPYGKHTLAWLRRLAAHGDGVALVFARTDTAWFHQAVPAASAVCLIRGRVDFVDRDGETASSDGGAPSMLVAYGDVCAVAVAASGLGMTFVPAAAPLLGQRTIWEIA